MRTLLILGIVASPDVAGYDVASAVRKADGTHQMTVVTMGTGGLVARSWRLDGRDWEGRWTDFGQPTGAPVRPTSPGVDGLDTTLPIVPGWGGSTTEVGAYFAYRDGSASVAGVDLDLASGSYSWAKRPPPSAFGASPYSIWELRESESGTVQWIDHGVPAEANSCVALSDIENGMNGGVGIMTIDVQSGDAGPDEIAEYHEETYVECFDLAGSMRCEEEEEPDDEGWTIDDDWDEAFDLQPGGSGATLATFFRPMVAVERTYTAGQVRHVFGTGSLFYRSAPSSAVRVAGKDHVFFTDGKEVVYLSSSNGTTWARRSLGAPAGVILGAPLALQKNFTVQDPDGTVRTIRWAAVSVVAYDEATARYQVWFSRYFDGYGWACWQQMGEAPALGEFALAGGVAYFEGASTRVTAMRVSLFGHTADGRVVRVSTIDGDEIFFETRAAPGAGIEVTSAAVIDTATFDRVCAFGRDDDGEVHALCQQTGKPYGWETLED